ncbi:MAG: hypothetical protein NFCOHLIN_00632 [Gammaproteobacteria bacterium]|nr:hypothetical protein [Gammaproteobacteria bacterium]
MKTSHPSSLRTVAVLVAASFLPAGQAGAAGEYEQPGTMMASQLLPAETLKGPNHQVQEEVQSDGFLNIYAIDTSSGVLKAVSTAQARQYAAEVEAAARMATLKSDEQFASGLQSTASTVVTGTTALLNDPGGALSGAVTGVGAMFGRAQEALASSGAKGAGEDSAMAGLSGFSKTKREYAYEFGVDVYSRNPVLQKQLDEVAQAAFAGNIAAKAAMMMIPGGAGVALSVTSSTATLNEAFRDLPPVELRKRNREKLTAMGVNADVTDLYLENAVFTPREQTLIVEALAAMADTGDRGAYIRHAVLTDNADLAYFRQRQAGMYLGYHRSVEPLARFVTVGKVAVGQKKDGTIVFCAPLDHLYWTPAIGAFVELFESDLPSVPDVKGKELWLGGTLSETARKELEARGWTVKEGSEAKLLALR